MVKTPRTRHSRADKEPVTIDLAPDDVSRVAAESAAPAPDDAARPETVAVEDEKATEDTMPEATSFGRQNDTAAATADDTAPRPAPEPQPQPRRGAGGSLLAGLLGGVAALALAAGLQLSGVLPGLTPAPTAPAAVDHGPAIAALEARLSELREEVSALAPGDDASLAARLAEAEAGLENLRGEVAGLSARPGGEAGAPIDLAPVEARIAAVEAALATLPDASASESALAALGQRLDALRGEVEAGRDGQAQAAARLDAIEAELRTLAGRVDEQAEAPATAVIIAASSLKAAIDRGTPFTTELDTYAALVPDAPQLDELRALAAAGVPTRAQLAAESAAAANAMIAAERRIDPDAGIADRLWGSMMGLVQVRPIGMVEGEGVPEIAARLDAAVQAGDYQRALAEFETLPPAAKAAGEGFVARLRARHTADRLADAALAAALKA